MTKQYALQLILGMGFIGVLFSGYLSYTELFGACAASCPTVPVGGIFGLPACVYGLVMYAAVCGIAIVGLRARK